MSSVRAIAAVLIAASAAVSSFAQDVPSIDIYVRETAGIRRTEFPLRARVALPPGTGVEVEDARLRLGDAQVQAQYTVVATWPDRSPRELEIDFNASLAPAEGRMYQLDFSGDQVALNAPARGLTVTEEGEVIHIGSMTFGRPGMPLMVSAFYARSEFIGTFEGALNGFAIVDERGTRHALLDEGAATVEIVRRGPLAAALRYTGAIRIGDGEDVPVALMVEMPASKSWVRVSASVTDPTRLVRELVLDTPFTMGQYPWTWDFGTVNGSYGALRSATDAVSFQQVVDGQGRHSWSIDTGPASEPRSYEISQQGSDEGGRLFGGWGHLVGASGAVAFGIDRFAQRPGTYAVTFDGRGQASYRYAPAGNVAGSHELVVYQHFVSTPVAIGAATNPASMLSPPVVTVEP